MAATIKGQQCTWGTDSAGVSARGGTVVSASASRTAQTESVEDSQGAEKGLVIYDEQYELTAEIVCGAGTAAPSIGDSFTCGGFSGYVTSCRENWQNKGKKSLSITAHGAKGL